MDTQKQFIADASHDLKTPLTVIMANNDIIKEHSKDSIESQMEWINSTQYEAERMRALVEKMLEIAKADAANTKLVFSEVNISELIEAISLQFEPVAFDRKVGITTDIKTGIVVNTDKDAFTRVIYTLIDNAIKYANPNTDVKVTLEQVNRHIKCMVNNKGKTISEKDAPNIFKRFYRADESRTSEGFGLGLAIAKNSCDSLGYKLDFVSNEAEGTTFEIIIK